jgi:hypothetical protein
MLMGWPLPMSPIVLPLTFAPCFSSETAMVTSGLQA